MDERKILEDLLAQSVAFESNEQMAEALVKDCELFTDALCAIANRWSPLLGSHDIKLTPAHLSRMDMAMAKLEAVDAMLDSLDRIHRHA